MLELCLRWRRDRRARTAGWQAAASGLPHALRELPTDGGVLRSAPLWKTTCRACSPVLHVAAHAPVLVQRP
jgi:hypothetical protein